ncbi:MAG TPA: ABC transporter permease [Acidobacteriaceae bacterium]|nr:ABC transporter permease [Acidobacteriaceae bacterium]
MQTLWQDIRYALRQLRKSPGFALTVVLTLVLGIGANTALFSVMNAVLLRTLPVRNPDQLFYLTHQDMPEGVTNTGDPKLSFNYNVYDQLRKDHQAFSRVIAYIPLSFTKTVVRFRNLPQEINADEVSGNFFSALGVRMAAGQAFQSSDETKHSQVAVISYGYWIRRFNDDPNVVGKTIYVKGVPFTIIGVAGPHFYGVGGGKVTDLWVPLQNRPELNSWGVPVDNNTLYGSPNWWDLMLMARLRPGVTMKQALARMDPVFNRAAYEPLGKAKPGARKLALQMVPARGLGTSSSYFQAPLRVLMGMVLLVLVIACVNIVMLLLARNSIREREFALRMALGAGRRSMFQQLLTESVILVISGATLGWVFAVDATQLLAKWSQLEVSLTPDRSVLLFTLAVSALAALIFGLAPLRTATNAPVGMVLRSGGAQTTAGRSRMLSGKILIAMQMAFCVVLLFAAGLLLRTLRNYQNVNLGMNAQSVLAFGVHPLGTLSHDQSIAFYNQLEQRLRALPGVNSVTLALYRPGGGWSDDSNAVVDGHTIPANSMADMLQTNEVGADFFKTLEIPILRGRGITAADTKGAPNIAVVNQTFADHFLKSANPIGHQLGDPKFHMTIVGLVRDSKYTSADEGKVPMAWYSYQQDPAPQHMDVEIRASGNPMAVLPEVRRVVHDMDPNIPLDNPQVLSQSFADTYLMPALYARLAVFFALLAALLVAVGLYGTLAYRVNRRTMEIGVRMALGAARGQVLWMILRDSLVLVGAGLLVGMPLAWFASKLMASMLFKLSAHDPVSFLVAGLGVMLVSLAGALIPARRAASVEPMQALRTE